MLLSAPWTPFNPDGSVNLAPIATLAKNFVESGVNTVWIVGGMGQFDALSVAERNAIVNEWTIQGHKQGLFVIAHVGHTSQPDAIAMAQYAKSIGADAIAAVPPYYELSDEDTLIDWFAPVLAAAPGLPFYYYHIPASTGQTLNVYTFTQKVYSSGKLPGFAGVKYVDPDFGTFFNCVNDPILNRTYNYMWAPEPKLTSFPIPGNGTILAESFYAGTFLRMWDRFNNGNMAQARAEQAWKMTCEGIFGDVGVDITVAKRSVYRTLCGIDMGMPRLPVSQVPITDEQYNELVSRLNSVGFFNQSIPSWSPPKN